MDTSKVYIQMCNKAKEVQELFRHRDTDYVYVLKMKKCGLLKNGFFDSKVVWLPRQDQLQEIIEIKAPEVLNEEYIPLVSNCNLMRFATWITTTESADPWYQIENKWQFKSMEQLWLAFVMKEKFSKIWNGEDWVETEREDPCL